MANADISLLFGVAGGGSLSGESGSLIQSQLNQIMSALNKSPLKVKIALDTEAGGQKSWNTQLQSKLNAISTSGKFSIQVSNIKIGSGAIADFKRQLNAVINTMNLDKGTSITLTAEGIGEVKSQLEQAGNAASDAARKTAEFKVQMEALSSLKTSVKQSLASLTTGNETEEEKARIAELNAQYEQWAVKIEEVRASKSAATGEYRAQLEQEGATIQANIAKIQQERQAILDESNAKSAAAAAADKAAAEEAEYRAQLDKVNNALVSARKNLENWTAAKTGKSSTSYSEIEREVQNLEDLKAQLINTGSAVGDFNTRFGTASTNIRNASENIRACGENTKTFAGHMGSLASKFTSWLTVSQVIMQVYRALRQMVTAVVEVDTAMTELKKVTDETDITYSRFLENATERAKELGATLADTVNATADFARLGYSLDEASELADATLVYKNVGDGIEDISEASESLISTMKAFGISAEDAMLIVDKFNETGNNFAISSKGVGDALTRSASALAAANNSLDESIALVTAANSTVQDADKVGTALKTVSMFLRAAKTEAEEAGESTDGMASSVSELRDELLALTGGKVDIQIDEETFKSTYQIMKELSDVWEELTDISQANILELIGGKRNSNVVMSLLENFNVAEEVMESTANAAGSALKENEKYLDSIEGKISQFKATFQDLSTTLISSSFTKSVVELGTGILNVLNGIASVIDALGGLNVVLPITIALVAALNLEKTISMLKNVVTHITNIGKAIFNSSFVKGLQAIHAGLTSAVTGSEAAASAFTMLGGAASVATVAITALVAIIGVAVIVYQKLKQAEEERRQAAVEAANAMQENADQVSEYKNQILSLRDAIDSGNLSEQEAYDKRQELIQIEQSLIDMFGKEAEGIDLVTGSIDSQIDALDKLSEKEWEAYRQENTKAIKKVTDLFTDYGSNIRVEMPSLTSIAKGIKDLNLDVLTSEFYSALNKELESFNITIPIDYYSDGGFVTQDFSALIDADSIYDVLDTYRALYDLTAELGQEYFGENYLDYIGDALSGYSEGINAIKSEIEENEGIFDTYVEGLLNYGTEYSEVWGQALAAQQEYNDALLNGDNNAAMAALQKMRAAKQAYLDAGWDNDAVTLYMDRFFEEFETESEGYELKLNLRAKLEDPEDTLGNMVKDALRVFEGDDGTVDLSRILNVGVDYERSGKANSHRAVLTEEEQAYTELRDAAAEYGMEVEDLYDLLVQLGYVHSAAAESARQLYQSYENLQSSVEASMQAQTALNDVFADNTYITEDTYNALTQLAGSEEVLAGCIDTTNGYLVTNADALQSLIEKSNDALLTNVKMAESHERLNYHELVSQLKDATDGMTDYDEATANTVDTILEQIDATQAQIAKYKLLEQQILGVTNAFTEMENAESLDEGTDYTEDLSDMIESLISSYENHEFGTEAFRTAFDALIPKDIYSRFTEAGDQIDAGWEYLNEKLSRYFTYDNGNISIDYSNIQQFVSDALSTSFGGSTVFTGTLENFDLNPQIQSVEELADAMGITITEAFALGNAISKYTADNDDFLSSLSTDTLEGQIYDCDQALAELLEKRAKFAQSGDINTDEWTQIEAEIQETSSAMNKLRSKARQNVHANIDIDSNITEKQAEVDELYEKLSELDGDDPEYSATMTNYQEAESELATLMQEKYALEQPTEVTIQAALEQVQSEIDTVKAELEGIDGYDADAEVQVATNPDDQARMDDLVQKLADLNGEYAQIQIYAGIDDEDVMSSLETIQNFVINDKNFNVSVSGYSITKKRLDNIISTLKNIKSKSITVTTNYTEGAVKATETAKAAGSAHESGNWGLKHAERRALVGELGTELVVDPNTGTYKTVGDNGAEFVDLPKGAIIFNHRQTEGLLKNKRINSRGTAYLEGNAHFNFVSGQYTFGTSTSNSDGQSSNATVNVTLDDTDLEEQLKDTLEEMAEDMEEIIGNFEHSIFLLERNGGSTSEIVAVYRKMQEAVHDQAEEYRALGLDENSDYIQELQKQWWEYQDSIQEAIVAEYDKLVGERENAIKLTENWMNNAIDADNIQGTEINANDIVAYYKQMQNIIHEQAEYYRSQGYSDTSDEVSELSDLWWEYADNIKQVKQQVIDSLMDMVEAASDAVDEIQNAYDVLHEAADEYAADGYISIDSLQAIIDLGPQYMQLLMDENGQLVINEERINAVIAARTQQLALENAITYVERIRLALQEGSVESLNNLLYVTTDATDATWGLVYAELALMHQMGDLDDAQYNAALHNIQSLQSLANSAISSIGQVAGSSAEELENMKTGLDDILQYVMDMLKQKINDQIDALEDMKDAYEDIIELRKEALEAAKDEANYQDEVADKIKEIAKLQERINALSLDDSREAQAQKVELEEEMYELQNELADKQSDYAINAQQDALDDMSEAYATEKDEEIAILEDSISSYQKLYDMAIDYIESHWDTLYNELISWNTEYGSVLNSEITTAWDNCLAAAQRYGSYVSALNSIDADISSASGDSISYIVSDSSSDASSTDEETVHSIIKRMYANSQAWHSASTSEQSKLDAENLSLGAMLARYGINAYRDNGTWYVDSGQLLFDKYKKYIYHKGGIAGDEPTLKQNEVMAVLEKGESVLDEKKELGLYRLIDFTTTLADKFGKLVSSSGYNTIFSGTDNGMPKSAELAPITESQNSSVAFGDVYIYGANDETVEKHREINREFTNKVLEQLKLKR